MGKTTKERRDERVERKDRRKTDNEEHNSRRNVGLEDGSDRRSWSDEGFTRIAVIWMAIAFTSLVAIVVFLILPLFLRGCGGDECNNRNDGNEEQNENDNRLLRFLQEEGYSRKSWSGNELFFLIFIFLVILALLPYGFSVLSHIGDKTARFGVGWFAGAIMMFSAMCLVFSILFGLFKGGHRNNGEEEDRRDEGTSNSPDSRLLAFLSIAFFIVYFFFGIYTFRSSQSTFFSGQASEPLMKAEDKALTTLFLRSYRALIALVIIAYIIMLCVVFVSGGGCNGEDCDNDADQGQENNGRTGTGLFIFVLIITFVFLLILAFIGLDALGSRGQATQLLIGTFCGALAMFSCYLFAMYIFFHPFMQPQQKNDKGENIQSSGPRTEPFSYFCLIMAIVYGTYSWAISSYSRSIVNANASDSGVWLRKKIEPNDAGCLASTFV